MTVSLKHTFTSAKTDSLDTSLVQPSNWNEEHQLTLATNKVLGRATAGTGAAEELSVGAALSVSGGTLAVTNVPVANGGTGAATLTGYVKGNGTSAFTAAASVPVGDISGTLPVASGGTGAVTLTANAVLVGNGTSAVTAVAPGTTGNVLTSNGTTWTSTALPAAGALLRVTVFTASGTWTRGAGTNYVLVRGVGGGGGGGGGRVGGGGGSGGYFEQFQSSAALSTATVTIGAGGGGGVGNGVTGTTGGDTLFGSIGRGNGGLGGTSGGTVGTGGVGGTATVGGLLVTGGGGGAAMLLSASFQFGGTGGSSFFGGGAAGVGSNVGGLNGDAYGSGGGGCTNSGGTAGAGAAGVIIVEEYV